MVLRDVSGDNLNCSHVNDVADSVVEVIFVEHSSADDLLPEWDSRWDSEFDICTVGGMGATEGGVGSACQTLAAEVAFPGVDHNAHKAMRLRQKPKAKATAKAKASEDERRRHVKEKAQKPPKRKAAVLSKRKRRPPQVPLFEKHFEQGPQRHGLRRW